MAFDLPEDFCRFIANESSKLAFVHFDHITSEDRRRLSARATLGYSAPGFSVAFTSDMVVLIDMASGRSMSVAMLTAAGFSPALQRILLGFYAVGIRLIYFSFNYGYYDQLRLDDEEESELDGYRDDDDEEEDEDEDEYESNDEESEYEPEDEPEDESEDEEENASDDLFHWVAVSDTPANDSPDVIRADPPPGSTPSSSW